MLVFVIWMWGSVIPIMALGAVGISVLENSVAFLYTFVVGYLGVLLVVRLLLGRPTYSVALPSWPPSLRLFGAGILIQLAAMTVMYLSASAPMSWRGLEHVTIQTVLTVGAALVGLLIQAGFEELYFRGLMMQATFRFTRWLPVVIGVQAYLFASQHTGNIAAWQGASLAMVPYLATAIALGWIAWRTGSLVLPMALHFMNNAFLLLFVQTEGDVLQGLAPLVAETPSIERASAFVSGQVLLCVLGVELLLRLRPKLRAARPA